MTAIGLGAALASPSATAQIDVNAQRKSIVNERFGQQLISLINFATVPGISGGSLDINRERPKPDYSINKLGVSGDTTFEWEAGPVDLYLEGGFSYLETDENSFDLSEVGGPPSVAVKTDRNITSGRVGVGPSIPLNEQFRLRPVFSVAVSHFRNETGLGTIDPGTGDIIDILNSDFELWAMTYAGSLQLRFDEQYGRGKAELQATVTGAYTDIVDAPNDALKIDGWNQVTTARARWSQMTNKSMFGQRVGWNVFTNLTVPAGAGRESLGFRFLLGIGGGIDFDLREKDLPFFEAVRPRASILVGDNVTGFSLGFGFRF